MTERNSGGVFPDVGTLYCPHLSMAAELTGHAEPNFCDHVIAISLVGNERVTILMVPIFPAVRPLTGC